MRTSTLRSLIFFAAGVGLIVSIFAALEFYEASLRSLCSIGSFFSCSVVDQSGKTSTLGVPDYAWGLGGFVLILVVAAIAEARSRDPKATYALLGVTTAGVAFSLYFLYVQLALIGAFCVVCASAYVFGWVAWAGTVGLARRVNARRPKSDSEPPSVPSS